MLSVRTALAFLLATTFVTTARADDDSAKCNPAYEEADALIKAGGDKLLDARAKLLVCARPVCKAWMVKECTTSLAEVSARIPSVVFSAKDSRGNELVEVTVTTGERSLASRLDGKAIDLGPGERTFTFVRPDGARAAVTAVVKEGEKAQRVTATFQGPKSDGAEGGASPAGTANGDGVSSGSSLATVGWVVAGVGVVGLGVGAIFGIKAIGSTNDANCDDKNTCEKGPLADARSSATVATIGFIAGGVLLAGGVSLILFAPRSKSGRSLEAAPSVAQNEAGLLFRGRW